MNEFSGPLAAALDSGSSPFFSWSQDGEDLILRELGRVPSIYVDVGAHHPTRFSVTRHLYDSGWHGVNIDASPGFSALFNAARPRDTNVESLVGEPGEREFFRFADPAYSTLDSEAAEQLIARGVELVDQEVLTVRSLSEILHGCLTPQALGLLSIDVEGADLEVLTSHDFEAFPPDRVLVECPESAEEIVHTEIHHFLSERGFHAQVVLKRSVLYEREGVE